MSHDPNPPWTVRPGVEEDAEPLMRLQERIVEAGPRFDMVAELAREISHIWWIEKADEALGYLVSWRIAGEAEILQVAVDPMKRRQGLGGKLLDAFLGAELAAGTQEVFLEVRQSNSGAIKLYDTFGFSHSGTRKGYYSNPPEDALLMRWSHDVRDREGGKT